MIVTVANSIVLLALIICLFFIIIVMYKVYAGLILEVK
jgi:hypothetical protein